jgi:SAM-dependent methyltransferase
MDQSAWDRRYAETDLVWSAGPNQWLVREVSDLEPGTGLDVACGEGRNALWLAERGWRMIGADFSSVAIDKARARAAERGVVATWEVADVRTWRCPVSVDLAIMFYLHQPWSMMQSAIANTAAAVEPGKTILIVGHDLSNLTGGHGGPSNASVLYTPEQIAGELEGFDVVRAERVEREVASAGAVAIDNLVRAVKR